MATERVPFKLLIMQCCGTNLCHVNHRLPNFCPECGERCQPHVKGWVSQADDNASLRYNPKAV